MGEVIAFRARAKAPRESVEPIAGDAQILFFLGVRYQRIDETHDAVEKRTPDLDDAPRGRKKRKARARA